MSGIVCFRYVAVRSSLCPSTMHRAPSPKPQAEAPGQVHTKPSRKQSWHLRRRFSCSTWKTNSSYDCAEDSVCRITSIPLAAAVQPHGSWLPVRPAPCAALPKSGPTTSAPAQLFLYCRILWQWLWLWLPPPAGVLSAHLIKPTNNHAFIMLLSLELPSLCVCGIVVVVLHVRPGSQETLQTLAN